MTWASRALAGLALIAALTVACGSSPSSSSSAKASPTPTPSKAAQITSVDACSLVTAAEASAAVGTTVTNLAGGAQIPGACIYGTQDSQASVFIYAEAYPDTTTADAISPDQIAAAMNGQYGISNPQPVSGLVAKA